MLKLIVFILLGFSQIFAADNTCSSVDLRSSMGPIRNQRDKGWCFANVAADLLGHAYLDILKGTQISSSFVAILTNNYTVVKEEKKPDLIFKDAGLIYQSIRTIQKEGYVCAQSVDETLLQQGLDLPLSKKLQKYVDMFGFIHTFSSSSIEMVLKKQSFIEELKKSKSILSLYPENQIEEILNEPTIDKSVLKLVNLFCQDTKIEIKDGIKFVDYFMVDGKTYEGSNKNYQTDRPINFLNEINIALNNHDPVGVSYEVGDITSPDGETGYHASVIVARYKDEKGQCKYLIRNSWGEDCTRGVLENGQYVEKPIYKYQCSKGHVLVDESLIQKSVKGITRRKR